MNYKIPLFDLNFDEREEQAVIETLQSKWISTGPKTVDFENKFSSLLNVKHSIALSNCTVALHLAMELCDIKAGDEVICPSLTFVATVNAIRYVNAIPVFADIKSYKDLTIDPIDIESKITSRTKAIVVMHYGGFACDMVNIISLAKKYRLKIIEDACHGPLSEYRGKKLGTIGDIGCFSFFSNKNISTGEGGMLITNNSEYFEKAKLLRSHGMTSLSYERSKGHSTGYDVIALGYNYRLDDIRAAIGIVQLDKIEEDLKKRALVRQAYLEELGGIDNIMIPFDDYTELSSNYIFPIVIKNSTYKMRDEIRNKLAESGIQTSVHYPAVHRFSIYKEFYKNLPITEYVTDNLITLPMFGSLNKSDISIISKTIKKLFYMKKILVISAHADDETFGMGGTLAKLSKSPKDYKLYWLILSKIWQPKWNDYAIKSRSAAIEKISAAFNFIETEHWDYKDNLMDTYSLNDMQERMIIYLDKIKPNIIFTPSPWDFNFEHRIAFELVEMSSKPFYSKYIEKIIAYEIPSSTDSAIKIFKNFPFNYYVNIEDELSKKIELMKHFDTEYYKFPHPRSEEYINALSIVRGAECGLKHAEGFCLVREFVK